MPQDAHMIVGIKGVHRNLLVTPPFHHRKLKSFFMVSEIKTIRAIRLLRA